MLDRCDRYCERTGIGSTTLAKMLTNNPAFLQWVRGGGNMTLRSYDRCMQGLAELELEAGIVRKSAAAHTRPSRKTKRRSRSRALVTPKRDRDINQGEI
jgi:hypothetical protein